MLLNKTRKSKSPQRKLFDRAWKLTSEYVRKRDKGQCFTCPVKRDPKEMHAGHFRHGKTAPTYFDLRNVHCQCPKCNTYLSGNRDIYLRNIQKKYGIEVGDELIRESYNTHYYKIEELERIIKNIEKLDKELGGVENSPF
jgi:uncharacterized protein YabN with tetrapyrrole methylase and pyrophosphatase domain